jgi:hypothetical protein
MADEIPVVCCLSDEETRNREATLRARFKSALVTTEEVSDGYLFRIPGDKKWIALAAELIVAERECCPLRGKPLRAVITEIVRGETLIRFL